VRIIFLFFQLNERSLYSFPCEGEGNSVRIILLFYFLLNENFIAHFLLKVEKWSKVVKSFFSSNFFTDGRELENIL